MKNHITLVGKAPLPIYYALREFGSDNVFFICTEDTEYVAEKVIRSLPGSIQCFKYIVDPYHPIEIAEACKRIHHEYKGEFLYNLTGGTKSMAFAAFNVAKDNNSQAIYITSQNEVMSLNDYQVKPLESRLTNQEIINLSGNKILNYEEFSDFPDEYVEGANLVYNFITKYKNIYSRFRREIYFYSNDYDLRLIPDQIILEYTNWMFKKEENGFSIWQGKSCVLNLPFDNASLLLFCGRWWEMIVSEHIDLWNKEKNKEIWQNVIFNFKSTSDQDRVKNEVDILINNDTKLIFIECKSGRVSQEDIYKINTVRETYGGGMSHSVLVSFNRIPEDIEEKCVESQIRYFVFNRYDKSGSMDRFSDFLNQLNDDLLV